MTDPDIPIARYPLRWSDDNGICDADGEQLFQIVRTYGSVGDRKRMGRWIVDAMNREYAERRRNDRHT